MLIEICNLVADRISGAASLASGEIPVHQKTKQSAGSGTLPKLPSFAVADDQCRCDSCFISPSSGRSTLVSYARVRCRRGSFCMSFSSMPWPMGSSCLARMIWARLHLSCFNISFFGGGCERVRGVNAREGKHGGSASAADQPSGHKRDQPSGHKHVQISFFVFFDD